MRQSLLINRYKKFLEQFTSDVIVEKMINRLPMFEDVDLSKFILDRNVFIIYNSKLVDKNDKLKPIEDNAIHLLWQIFQSLNRIELDDELLGDILNF